jgi:hypothetical protein
MRQSRSSTVATPLVGERRGLVEGQTLEITSPLDGSVIGRVHEFTRTRSEEGQAAEAGGPTEEQVRQEMDAPRRERTALDLDVRSTNRRSQ